MVRSQNKNEPAKVGRRAVGDRDILSVVGEVVYDWSIGDDIIRWGENALDVLPVTSFDQIASGRHYAALLDPGNLTSRQSAILDASEADEGEGVAYRVQYALRPDVARTQKALWVEDIGRWYAGDDGRPARALGVLRVISERRERELRHDFLSRYDSLTGFFNRAHLLESLDASIASAIQLRSPIAFLLVAVDNFDDINASFGFPVGDQILAAVAGRIRAYLRAGDAIGRYSGSKLGLVLLDCDDRDMQVAAERFHASVAGDPLVVDTGAVGVTVSIGGVILPRHAGSAGDAIARAREALQTVEVGGRSRFAAYANSSERLTRWRRNVETSSDLVSALNERRVRLALKAVIDSRTQTPEFQLATTRIERPDGSMIAVQEFLGAAGPVGLQRMVDRRVLQLAIDALGATPDVVLGIDVSVEAANDAEWLTHLSAAAAAEPGLAKRLIVGVTEAGAEAGLDALARFIGALHSLGSRAALDDFGDGFSSIRGLRILGADFVRIANVYVESLSASREARALVEALGGLARKLGVRAIAGPVDDQRTAALLSDFGIDLIWGGVVGETRVEEDPVTTLAASPHIRAGAG